MAGGQFFEIGEKFAPNFHETLWIGFKIDHVPAEPSGIPARVAAELFIQFECVEILGRLPPKIEGTDAKYNVDERAFNERWKNPGDIALYKNIAITGTTPKHTDRFVEKENVFTLTTFNLGYEFNQNICSRLHVRNLRLGVNFTDLFRISTVKIERGTDYLYSNGFEFTLSTTF